MQNFSWLDLLLLLSLLLFILYMFCPFMNSTHVIQFTHDLKIVQLGCIGSIHIITCLYVIITINEIKETGQVMLFNRALAFAYLCPPYPGSEGQHCSGTVAKQWHNYPAQQLS